EIRELMAGLGFRRMDEMIGRVDCLKAEKAAWHWKAAGLDLSPLLAEPQAPRSIPRRWAGKVSDNLSLDLKKILDQEILAKCQAAVYSKTPVNLSLAIKNTDRATGTYLSSRVALLHGEQGLPEDTVQLSFKGSAGQSFGAFLARGITLRLEGEANDYVGKGL